MMTTQIKIVNLKKQIKEFFEWDIKGDIESDYDSSSTMLTIERIERDGEEYDGLGIDINIINKEITNLCLVDDFGNAYSDLITEDEVEYIKEQLINNGIFNYA